MENKTDHLSPTVRNTTNSSPVQPCRVKQFSKVIALVLTCLVALHVYRLPMYPTPHTGNDLNRHHHKDIVPLRNDDELFFGTRTSSNPYHTPKAQYTFCDHTDRTMQIATEFNVTDEFHFHDTSLPQDARGLIHVQRGPDAQIADIEVKITIAYASPSLPVVSSGFDPRTGTMRLSYSSTGCVQVRVDINLRPDVRKGLRSFEMVTEMLDLWLRYSLSWTIDNLNLHSSHGTIDNEASYFEKEPLITHNVSASSVTGDIEGFIVPDGHLHFRNEADSIDIGLIPRSYSDVPMVLESINASTDSGRLSIRIWAQDMKWWSQEPYTHTTQIRSETGFIRASVPLGTLTNYTSETGNIAASVVPWGAAIDDASKDFRTETNHGNTYVNVYNTIQESLKDGMFDPLLSLRSRHQVMNGSLTIRYPYSWYGKLEGLATDGTLELDGSRLKDVRRGDNWVKARRGEGMSFMESWAHHGDLDIKVGLGPL